MKKISVILIILILSSKNAFAIDKKKFNISKIRDIKSFRLSEEEKYKFILNESALLVKTRESNHKGFSVSCYKDGKNGNSIGYGNYRYCKEQLLIRRSLGDKRSDIEIMKKITITQEFAEILLYNDLIEFLDRFKNKWFLFEDKILYYYDLMDWNEIIAILDRIYNIGETVFYNSKTFTYLKQFVSGNWSCVNIKSVLYSDYMVDWHKTGNYVANNGVKSRRQTELELFLFKKCVFSLEK